MRNRNGQGRVHRWLRCSAAVVVLGVSAGACSTKAASSDASAATAQDDTFVAAAETLAAAEEANSAAAPQEPAAKSSELAVGGQRPGTVISEASGTVDGVGAPTPLSPSFPRTGAQIKRSEIALRVPTSRFNLTISKLSALPGSLGGFVQSSTVGGGDPIGDGRLPRNAVIVMRIPASSFDDTRSRIASYGTFVREQISGEEVSGQLVDLDARVASLRLQEEAYRKLFNAASKIQDIITVQERLTEVRTQIEQITAQRAVLGDQVAFSTVSVNVEERLAKSTVRPPAPSEQAGFSEQVSDAWDRGRDALSAFLTAIAVVFVAMAPFAPVLAVIVLLAWWLQSRARSRAAIRTAAIGTAAIEHDRRLSGHSDVAPHGAQAEVRADSDSTQPVDRENIRT